MLPLAKWIYDRIGNDKIKRKDLIHKLGYINLNRGNIVLNSIILGYYSQNQIADLKIALSDDNSGFEKVVKENELHLALIKGYKQVAKDNHEKSIFQPHIKLETEKQVSKNMPAREMSQSYLLSRYKDAILLNPKITEEPIQDQIRLVEEKVIEKYGNHYSYEFYFTKLGRIVSIKYHYDFYYSVDIDFEEKIQAYSFNTFCNRTKRSRFDSQFGLINPNRGNM